MIRLQLLGAVDLREEDGRELRAVLAQPKRLALLAYLGAATPLGSQRRDTLLGLFWPELDQEHARNALSKAIHFLRRALGEGAIVSRTAEELALDENAVWVDVRAFGAALEGQRLDEALELYRGDLLPSFFVPEVPGFEEWLERERARLRVRAAAAARLLAERHEAGRHLTLAVSCARRATELSDGDERPIRRLIELLDRVGDRAGAVRVYEEFARKLVEDLEVEPAQETVALIHRIRTAAPRPVNRTSPPSFAEPSSPTVAEPAIARLARGVAQRYKIERQLGEGAMAVVALAHDLRHHRRVAIKILRPELSSLMGPERFLREIDIAASLMHPHILPLHDSGETEGLLYYVMPYVEGESLRGRLDREHRLPVDDALQIAREVAGALAYAHHRGFVHRDIKPENILLGGGHALVADFGIARAVGSAGGEQLMTKGLGTGTPAYMSPEQMTGETPVDERTDIYALGCVVYEMLGGEPPFSGHTPEEIAARRLSEPVKPISALRDEVGAELASAIAKALARAPSERFDDVAEFAAALVVGLPQEAAVRKQAAVPRAWKPWSILSKAVFAGLAVLLFLSGALGAYFRDRSAPPSSMPVIIAVMPFRVLGADSLLEGLAEGMVDLLATRLGAGANVRVVDPRTTFAAWRRRVARYTADVPQQALITMAAELGAHVAITGSVVGAAGKVTLAASLLDVPKGTARSSGSITGDADSLMPLVDRLSAQLLSLNAGEEEHRLAALTSTSLPALRAYLEGQAASRRFLFDRARDHFADAVQLDSTFALAALGLSIHLQWGNTRTPYELRRRAERLMWTFSDRLSPRDQLRIRARFGANHPAGTSPAEQIAFVDSVLALIPDDPQLWWDMGDLLLHGGAHLGIPNWRERTKAVLRRAIELDSSFLSPRHHLVILAMEAGDTASVRALREYYVNHAPAEATELIRWRASAALGESAPRRGGERLEALSEQTLRRIVMESPSFGLRLNDAEHALMILFQRSASSSERERTLLLLREFALNRGRPAESLRSMREMLAANRAEWFQRERRRELVYHALYWDGDTAAGAQAARELAQGAELPPELESERLAEQARDRCVLEQWRLSQMESQGARHAIAFMDNVASRLPRPEAARARACAALLEAVLASAEQRSDVLNLLNRFDSLHMTALPNLINEAVWFCAGNIVSARLRSENGDLAGALAAIRRRGEPGDQKILLSTYLLEESRLSALAGDTAGAIRAYQHYLVLRSDPEPSLIPQRDSVRTRLAQLQRETS